MRGIGNTRAKAIAKALHILQETGYRGLTLQLLADELGIKKPSLYDHFKCKEDLVTQVIEDSKHTFVQWTETISVFDPEAQVGALFEVFYKFSCDQTRLCPLTALIGDFSSYPKKMKSDIKKLYDSRIDWLEEIIKRGQRNKIFSKSISAKKLADLIFATGLGAQLVARVTQNPKHIREQKDKILKILKSS